MNKKILGVMLAAGVLVLLGAGCINKSLTGSGQKTSGGAVSSASDKELAGLETLAGKLKSIIGSSYAVKADTSSCPCKEPMTCEYYCTNTWSEDDQANCLNKCQNQWHPNWEAQHQDCIRKYCSETPQQTQNQNQNQTPEQQQSSSGISQQPSQQSSSGQSSAGTPSCTPFSTVSCTDYCKDSYGTAAYSSCYSTCDADNATQRSAYLDCISGRQPTVPPPAQLPAPSAQYYSSSDLTPGQTITAPPNQPANIVTKDQNIFLRAGAAIQRVDQYTWKLLSGTVRFLEKVAINGRNKVRLNGGNCVADIRGTHFIMSASGDTTVISVFAGLVSIAPANSKKTVTVNAGYQLTATGSTLSKPIKFDSAAIDTSWYENIPAGTNFADASWKKMAANTTWSRDCAATINQATATAALTADEQAALDYLNNQAIPAFRIHMVDLMMGESKISATKEKTTLNGGTKVARMMTDAKNFYYSGDSTAASWRAFKDKTMINNLLQAAKMNGVVTGIDQSTLTFDHWEKIGNARAAVFTAKATAEGTSELIKSVSGSAASAGQELAIGSIYIDEETRQWVRSDVNVNVKEEKLLLPVYQICQLTYDTAVKIKIPAKFKSVNAKTGAADLEQIYSAVQ